MALDVDSANTAAINAALPSESGFVVVSALTQTSANIAARTWAATQPAADTVVLAPKADGFRVDEVDDAVRFAALAPQERNIITLLSADTLTPALFSRLLKTLESPPAPTVFVAAVSEDIHLPDPVLGRVTGHASVAPPSVTDLAPAVAAAVAPRFELAEVLPLPERLADLELVVGCEAPFQVPAAAKALTALSSSASVRRDVLRLAAHRHAELVDPLSAAAFDKLAAVDAARSLVARFASPASVLTALVTPPRPFTMPHRSLSAVPRRW